MKEKRIVTYIKNGKLVTKEFNFFSRKSIVYEIFDKPYIQGEHHEYYKINKEVTFLSLENITFKKEARFILTDHTSLILKGCNFKGGRLFLIGGSVELLEPRLNPCYYTNRIDISEVNKLNIIIDKENVSFITIAGTAKDCLIDAEDRINQIDINANNVHLKNMKEAKDLKIEADEILLDNCKLYTDIEKSTQNFETKSLTIKDSELIYQNMDESMEISADLIHLQNSNIYFNDPSFVNGTIRSDKLKLENSIIESSYVLNLPCQNIEMDEKSELKASRRITFKNDTYCNKDDNNDLEITKQKLELLDTRRKFISILKGIEESQKEETSQFTGKKKVRSKGNN